MKDIKLRELIARVDGQDPTFSECRSMAAGVADLIERLDGLDAWARNRIACCDAALTGRNGDQTLVGVARYEQEQSTLRAVLSILNGDAP
jgi:hypothetical protein